MDPKFTDHVYFESSNIYFKYLHIKRVCLPVNRHKLQLKHSSVCDILNVQL